jgi:hypothetical protein
MNKEDDRMKAAFFRVPDITYNGEIIRGESNLLDYGTFITELSDLFRSVFDLFTGQ